MSADSDSVELRLVETSRFYRLLDRPPSYARLVCWFDAPHRMDEFKTWEAQHDPAELAYLLPGGKLQPDFAHAKRWKAALIAWRRAVHLPERY